MVQTRSARAGSPRRESSTQRVDVGGRNDGAYRPVPKTGPLYGPLVSPRLAARLALNAVAVAACVAADVAVFSDVVPGLPPRGDLAALPSRLAAYAGALMALFVLVLELVPVFEREVLTFFAMHAGFFSAALLVEVWNLRYSLWALIQ